MRIQELLRAKGFEVITITASASVAEAVSLLDQHNLGSLVVTGEDGRIVGIVSERDIIRRLRSGADFLDGEVAAVMTGDVVTCRADSSVQALMSTMTERRIRHLPVVGDRDELIGIVSIGDLVKSYITEVEFERDQLQDYVSG